MSWTIKSLLALILLTLLFFGCGRDKANVIVDDIENPSFEEFIQSMPNKSLPLELDCGLPDGTDFSDDFKRFYKYIPKSTDRIFGRINTSSDNYKLIIYGQSGDDIYPIVFSYSNEGILKDSLFLILHGCGAADAYQIPHSFVSISRNLTFTLTDTTRLIHISEEAESGNDYIIDSLRISRVIIKVDQNGKFVKQ